MFGFFKKKKNKIQQLIAEQGYENAVAFAARAVIAHIPDRSAALEFVLQELDGASLGHESSQKAASESGIPPNQYKGTLQKDVPTIRVAQDHITNYSIQLADDRDLMARFRVDIGRAVMRHFELGRFSDTAVGSGLDSGDGEVGANQVKAAAAEFVTRVVREQGAPVSQEDMRRLVENVSVNIGDTHVCLAGPIVLGMSALTSITANSIDLGNVEMANVYFRCVIAAFDKHVKAQIEYFTDYQKSAIQTIIREFSSVKDELANANLR